MFEACQTGKTKIVKLLLENYNCEDSGKEIIPETDEEAVQSLEMESDELMQILKGSKNETQKSLAEVILLQKWKGKMLEACKTGKKEIVQLLLEHYTDEESGLNRKDQNGMSPLMLACNNGHKDVVQILIEKLKKN